MDSFTLFKEGLDKNLVLSVFEAYHTDMPSEKQIELAEIITNKAVQRKDQTFISTAAVIKYMDDQRKAKDAKDHVGEFVEEEIPADSKKDKDQKVNDIPEGEQPAIQEDPQEDEA